MTAEAVTFAFTDIEDSAARWERDREAMQAALRRHDRILRDAITQHGGRVFKTMGEAFFSAFAGPENAVAAMVAAQRALNSEDFSAVGGLRVRAAINSGTAEEREGDYFGPPVNKVARLLAIGHGGQILVTSDATALAERALPRDVALRDLGAYHLKDFEEPQRVYQVIATDLPVDFPALRSLGTLPSDLAIVDPSEIRAVQNFSGREAEVAALESALSHAGAVAVVHGLGGTGKSSLAREYGWRNRDGYSVVWWLNAQTEDGIVEGLLRLGAMFAGGPEQVKDRRAAANQVLHSMLAGFDKRVLLVFDNLEDEQLLWRWLPRTAQALVTSRDAVWSREIVRVRLHTWSLQAATDYLKVASGRSDLGADDGRAIVEALGAFPLALAQAAAALRTLRMITPQKYLERINDHLKRAPRDVEYPKSVFATFSAAIGQAEQQAAGAAAVLRLAAAFAPDAIPQELLRQRSDDCPEGLRPDVPAADALDLRSALTGGSTLDGALQALERFALIGFVPDTGTYSMHRLVQLVARGLVDHQREWQEFAVSCAVAAFPPRDFASWPQCERILPHARAALEALPDKDTSLAAADLARRCASYLWARGEYAAAEQLTSDALTICETVLGPNHPQVGVALNNLAVLYMERGQFDEAEALLTRAIRIREELLGPDHLELATSLNNLAIVSMELGRHEQAFSLATRALAIRERAQGPEHPDAVLMLNNVGVLYHRSLGRHAEAESVLTRVRAIREAAFGPQHPDVALTTMHLADVYADWGRHADAESLYLRALAIWEKALGEFGPDHPDVAEALSGLAKIYYADRRYAEAETAFKQALKIREKVLGPEHPLTKATRDALAALERDRAPAP